MKQSIINEMSDEADIPDVDQPIIGRTESQRQRYSDQTLESVVAAHRELFPADWFDRGYKELFGDKDEPF